MKKITLLFLTDPGHGWLKVRRSVVEAAGVAQSISQYSYQRNNHVYLEQDCDAGQLLEALKAQGVEVKIKNVTARNKQSKIRSYHRYTKPYVSCFGG